MIALTRLSLASFCLLVCNICNAQTYTIGVEDIVYYPAYSYENDQFGGYGRALLDAFAQRKGYEFKYKAYPVNRLYLKYLNQELDFKYPDHANWKLDSKKKHTIFYSQPAGNYIDGVMVRPDDKDKPLDQLKVLGTILGFTPWDYLSLQTANNIKIEESPSYEHLLNKIINIRIDGIYSNIEVAKYQLKKLGYNADALVFNAKLPHSSDSYRLSSIKHPDIISEFNQFLKQEKAFVSDLENKFNLR